MVGRDKLRGVCVCVYAYLFNLIFSFLWAVLERGLKGLDLRNKEGLGRESSARIQVRGKWSVDL